MTKNNQTIPKGWAITEVGDISKVVAGFGFPIRFQGKTQGKYPFAKVSDMNRPGNEKYISYAENYLDESDLKEVKVKTYPAGTVIFPKVGAALLTNKRRILKIEALIDNNIMGLIPKRVDTEFLYYWFLSFDVKQHVGNGALPSINQGYVEKIKLLLPPKPEQEKIAEILGAVDEDIEKTEKVIEKTEKLKRGLMRELLTKKDYKIGKFSDLVLVRNKKFDPKQNLNEKYIGLEHIDQNSGVLLGFGKSSETQSLKSVFKKGDILFGKLRPYLRKYWKAEFDGVCTTEILVFEPKLETDSNFIFQLVQTDGFIETSNSKSFGTKMPRTDWSIISKYQVRMPGREERKTIGDILYSVDEKIETNKKLKDKLTSLKWGLMQDLLTGKVRTI